MDDSSSLISLHDNSFLARLRDEYSQRSFSKSAYVLKSADAEIHSRTAGRFTSRSKKWEAHRWAVAERTVEVWWQRLRRPVCKPTVEAMYFRQFIHEEKSCLSYLIGCQSGRAAVVVDPQENIALYIAAADREGMSIQCVVDTHTHADHVSGARALADAVGAPVTTPRDGEVYQVGNRVLEVIATPGHTPDSVCLSVDDWYVLTGDTLFVSDVGRVDLALEDLSEVELRRRAGQLYDSLQRLLTRPEWTEVYPGHFGGSACGKGISGKMVSTIGRERRKNRALRMTRERFMNYVLTETPLPPKDFREIKQRNIAARVPEPVRYATDR